MKHECDVIIAIRLPLAGFLVKNDDNYISKHMNMRLQVNLSSTSFIPLLFFLFYMTMEFLALLFIFLPIGCELSLFTNSFYFPD